MGSDKHKKSHKRKYSDDSDSNSSEDTGIIATSASRAASSGTQRHVDAFYPNYSSHSPYADRDHKHSKKHKKEKSKKVWVAGRSGNTK